MHLYIPIQNHAPLISFMYDNTFTLNNKLKYLKMLGLYLYTRIIGHKSCNMLSIQNKLTLKKELQNFVTNNVFFDKM